MYQDTHTHMKCGGIKYMNAILRYEFSGRLPPHKIKMSSKFLPLFKGNNTKLSQIIPKISYLIFVSNQLLGLLCTSEK